MKIIKFISDAFFMAGICLAAGLCMACFILPLLIIGYYACK